VGALQPLQLQAVFDGTKEAVRLDQRVAVRSPDVAALGERPQRIQCGRRAQRRIAPAVHELQQLHRELDVPQPARTALDFAVHLLERDVVDDAAAHRAHVLDRVGPLGRLPDHRCRAASHSSPRRQVARGRPRLEHRLELPGAGPLR
jgi:hypothetical protein